MHRTLICASLILSFLVGCGNEPLPTEQPVPTTNQPSPTEPSAPQDMLSEMIVRMTSACQPGQNEFYISGEPGSTFGASAHTSTDKMNFNPVFETDSGQTGTLTTYAGTDAWDYTNFVFPVLDLEQVMSTPNLSITGSYTDARTGRNIPFFIGGARSRYLLSRFGWTGAFEVVQFRTAFIAQDGPNSPASWGYICYNG